MQETQVRSLGREDPLEKEMATRSSTLAWRISWTVQSQRLWHDWATNMFNVYSYRKTWKKEMWTGQNISSFYKPWTDMPFTNYIGSLGPQNFPQAFRSLWRCMTAEAEPRCSGGGRPCVSLGRSGCRSHGRSILSLLDGPPRLARSLQSRLDRPVLTSPLARGAGAAPPGGALEARVRPRPPLGPHLRWCLSFAPLAPSEVMSLVRGVPFA